MTGAGRVLLVTGASSGIGAATARRAAASGHRLALVARSRERLEELAAELGGPERALAIPADVTEWADQESMVEQTLTAFGRLDVAFANAGFGAVRGFRNESPEHWRQMILTNVYGAALTIRASLPALQESRGHIVLTGSVAGHVVVPGSVYSSTKFAVGAMAEAARKELHGSGIRVTLISPGTVDTPFYENEPSFSISADDVALAVLWALEQPPHVDVNEILIRPTDQEF